MKQIATAGLVLATMTGAALAADLPSRVAPPVYAPPPLPVFTWTGAYFGINAGYAFDAESRFRQSNGNVAAAASGIGNTRPAAVNLNADGFTGGGQIGYNYQLGGFGAGGFGLGSTSIVVGFEADAAYTDLTRTSTVAGTVPTTLNTFRSNMDFLGTVRGRVGLAFGQTLIYATGGFAYGDVYNQVTFLNGVTNTLRFRGSRDGISTGYTVGGGIEYALPTNSFLNFFKSSAVTVKAEYLYYDLGSRSFSLPSVQGIAGNPAAGVAYATKVHNDGNLVRVGLNYKFGSY